MPPPVGCLKLIVTAGACPRVEAGPELELDSPDIGTRWADGIMARSMSPIEAQADLCRDDHPPRADRAPLWAGEVIRERL